MASGKYAQGVCDRCGNAYPYQTLKAEWNGLRVCTTCYDPKHPQLTPKTVADDQALTHARTLNDSDGGVSVSASSLGLGGYAATYPDQFGSG